jgi:transcription-repair coupling factor (superfamily II helicase)
VLRRLAHPEEDGPLSVVVATVRSLVQPMAPALGELEPVRLRVGDEVAFESLVQRLAGLAYTRVDMVEGRGEFAVRGGIVDVFPPCSGADAGVPPYTAEHPLRVEFWGDEVSEIRTFAVADQRSLDSVDELHAPPCRELLLTESVRDRAAALAKAHAGDARLVEMLDKLAAGIPCEGMEALIPALLDGTQMQMLTDVMPAGTHVLLADPERIRARAADLVRTGQEFLEASWSVAGGGGDAPIDLGASAYRSLAEVAEHARAAGVAWWTLGPFAGNGGTSSTAEGGDGGTWRPPIRRCPWRARR